MDNRRSFVIAMSISTTGWLLSALALIILLAVASSPIVKDPVTLDRVWTQAFYYGIMAAGLYCIVSFSIILTILGAYRKHYSMRLRIGVNERSIMLQTAFFLAYLLLGALVFLKIEGW